MNDIRIDYIKPQEIGEAIRIEAESFSEAEAWDAEGYVDLLDGPGGEGYFAYYAGAPAGALWCQEFSEGTIEVASLAVYPQFRGKGIGRALMERMIADATRGGSSCLMLECRPSNTGALKLYASLGFIEDKRLPDYYENGEEAIRMLRKL